MNTITTDLYADIAFTLIKCELFNTTVDLLLTNTCVNYVGRSVVQIAYRAEKQRPPNHIDSYGVKEWGQNGGLHRDWDLPAAVNYSGANRWFKNGELHRGNDKPAVYYYFGTKIWWKNGKQHRDGDLPAVICDDGKREWWKNGVQYTPKK